MSEYEQFRALWNDGGLSDNELKRRLGIKQAQLEGYIERYYREGMPEPVRLTHKPDDAPLKSENYPGSVGLPA